MKKQIAVVFLALLFAGSMAGCKGKKKEEAVRWKQKENVVLQQVREHDEIEISYPVAEGNTALEINREITRAVAGFLGDPDKPVTEVAEALLAERNRDSVIRHIDYTLIVNGEVSGYGKIASVTLNMYQYLGGAHGIGRVECLSFDTETGKRIAFTGLFDDQEELTRLNKRYFMKEAPEQADELFIPVDELPLPGNAVLDSAGLHIYYNPYEIAPYSAGPTEYLIPLDEVKRLLKEKAF